MNFLRSIFYIAWTPFQIIIDPRQWFTWPARLVRLSIPGLAALVMFVFLVALTITFAIINVWQEGVVAPRWIVGALPAIILLIIAIPAVTYYAVKIWLQETGERFEDIERAFQAGMEELRRRGFDLAQMPLFLVLGSESDSREHHVMMSSRQEFQISRFPSGKEPLHWYVSDDAVYIVLSGVGCLTHLAREAVKVTMDHLVQAPVAGPPKSGGVNQTYWPEDDESISVSAARSQSVTGSVMPVVERKIDLSRTVAPDEDDSLLVRNPHASRLPGSAGPKVKPLSPRREVLELEQRRLKFLCRLIVDARNPVCPINGAITLLPLNMILADDTGNQSLNALRSDMGTLVADLRLRFPVVPFVVGWEDDVGFQELTRRIGPEHAKDSRFGKGLGLWTPPTQYTLEAVAEHACRGFETWIYKFFKQKDALEKTGNKLLYGLMCKVRRFLQPRLEVILKAFECTEDKANIDDVPLLSGVYFAAAGGKPDQQAFSSSVFARLIKELEGEVTWTPAAQRADAIYRTIAWLGFIIAGLSVAGVIVMVFWGNLAG
ncbi:MAG TPA: hypothetical protein VL096_16730 [Pirellulaceae bacterium]|nr:hypothetical protein [Pirellulaceae bacterium]